MAATFGEKLERQIWLFSRRFHALFRCGSKTRRWHMSSMWWRSCREIGDYLVVWKEQSRYLSFGISKLGCFYLPQHSPCADDGCYEALTKQDDVSIHDVKCERTWHQTHHVLLTLMVYSMSEESQVRGKKTRVKFQHDGWSAFPSAVM